MDKQEMIDKIYDVIATKRKEYCKLCPRCNSKVSREKFSDWSRTSHEAYECKKCWELTYTEWEQIDNKTDSIVEYNNPVMIGDVLGWLKDELTIELREKKWPPLLIELYIGSKIESMVNWEWKFYRKPIEDQPIECIENIYNLI